MRPVITFLLVFISVLSTRTVQSREDFWHGYWGDASPENDFDAQLAALEENGGTMYEDMDNFFPLDDETSRQNFDDLELEFGRQLQLNEDELLAELQKQKQDTDRRFDINESTDIGNEVGRGSSRYENRELGNVVEDNLLNAVNEDLGAGDSKFEISDEQRSSPGASKHLPQRLFDSQVVSSDSPGTEATEVIGGNYTSGVASSLSSSPSSSPPSSTKLSSDLNQEKQHVILDVTGTGPMPASRVNIETSGKHPETNIGHVGKTAEVIQTVTPDIVRPSWEAGITRTSSPTPPLTKVILISSSSSSSAGLDSSSLLTSSADLNQTSAASASGVFNPSVINVTRTLSPLTAVQSLNARLEDTTSPSQRTDVFLHATSSPAALEILKNSTPLKSMHVLDTLVADSSETSPESPKRVDFEKWSEISRTSSTSENCTASTVEVVSRFATNVDLISMSPSSSKANMNFTEMKKSKHFLEPSPVWPDRFQEESRASIDTETLSLQLSTLNSVIDGLDDVITSRGDVDWPEVVLLTSSRTFSPGIFFPVESHEPSENENKVARSRHEGESCIRPTSTYRPELVTTSGMPEDSFEDAYRDSSKSVNLKVTSTVVSRESSGLTTSFRTEGTVLAKISPSSTLTRADIGAISTPGGQPTKQTAVLTRESSPIARSRFEILPTEVTRIQSSFYFPTESLSMETRQKPPPVDYTSGGLVLDHDVISPSPKTGLPGAILQSLYTRRMKNLLSRSGLLEAPSLSTTQLSVVETITNPVTRLVSSEPSVTLGNDLMHSTRADSSGDINKGHVTVISDENKQTSTNLGYSQHTIHPDHLVRPTTQRLQQPETSSTLSRDDIDQVNLQTAKVTAPSVESKASTPTVPSFAIKSSESPPQTITLSDPSTSSQQRVTGTHAVDKSVALSSIDPATTVQLATRASIIADMSLAEQSASVPATVAMTTASLREDTDKITERSNLEETQTVDVVTVIPIDSIEPNDSLTPTPDRDTAVKSPSSPSLQITDNIEMHPTLTGLATEAATKRVTPSDGVTVGSTAHKSSTISDTARSPTITHTAPTPAASEPASQANRTFTPNATVTDHVEVTQKQEVARPIGHSPTSPQPGNFSGSINSTVTPDWPKHPHNTSLQPQPLSQRPRGNHTGLPSSELTNHTTAPVTIQQPKTLPLNLIVSNKTTDALNTIAPTVNTTEQAKTTSNTTNARKISLTHMMKTIASNKPTSGSSSDPIVERVDEPPLATTEDTPDFDRGQGHHVACPPKAAAEYCVNGGTCLRIPHVGVLACECAPGYQGIRCKDWLPDKYRIDLTSDEIIDTALGFAVAVTSLVPIGGVTTYAYYSSNNVPASDEISDQVNAFNKYDQDFDE